MFQPLLRVLALGGLAVAVSASAASVPQRLTDFADRRVLHATVSPDGAVVVTTSGRPRHDLRLVVPGQAATVLSFSTPECGYGDYDGNRRPEVGWAEFLSNGDLVFVRSCPHEYPALWRASPAAPESPRMLMPLPTLDFGLGHTLTRLTDTSFVYRCSTGYYGWEVLCLAETTSGTTRFFHQDEDHRRLCPMVETPSLSADGTTLMFSCSRKNGTITELWATRDLSGKTAPTILRGPIMTGSVGSAYESSPLLLRDGRLLFSSNIAGSGSLLYAATQSMPEAVARLTDVKSGSGLLAEKGLRLLRDGRAVFIAKGSPYGDREQLFAAPIPARALPWEGVPVKPVVSGTVQFSAPAVEVTKKGDRWGNVEVTTRSVTAAFPLQIVGNNPGLLKVRGKCKSSSGVDGFSPDAVLETDGTFAWGCSADNFRVRILGRLERGKFIFTSFWSHRSVDFYTGVTTEAPGESSASPSWAP